MIDWEYEREEEQRLTAGDYRVEIVSAEEKTSKNGNPMIDIGIRPNNSGVTLHYYLVKNQYFNRNATRFFDAFPQIKPGSFELLTWVGCTGAARIEEDGDFMRVKYFIYPSQADSLPAWVGKKPEPQTVTSLDDDELLLDDDEDMPF